MTTATATPETKRNLPAAHELKWSHGAGMSHRYVSLPGTNLPKTDVFFMEPAKLQIQSVERTLESGALVRDITSVDYEGEKFAYSDRFGNSVLGLIGQSRSVFNMFAPAEVIDRAVSQNRFKNPIVKVTAITRHDGQREVLSVVNKDTQTIDSNLLLNVLEDSGVNPKHVAYADGKITTAHDPAVAHNFLVMKDELSSKFVLNTPLDGYGSPDVFLAIIRAVCTNLNVFYNPIFRTHFKVGKGDIGRAFGRFLSAFNNEEGFAAIQNRLEVAAETPASVANVLKLRDAFQGVWGTKENVDTTDRFRLREHFGALIRGGADQPSLHQVYGVADFDEVPLKRQAQLAAKCSVYDLLNFVTEYSTHYVVGEQYRRRLNASIAEVYADAGGFDLEGKRVDFGNPKGLWLPDPQGDVSLN